MQRQTCAKPSPAGDRSLRVHAHVAAPKSLARVVAAGARRQQGRVKSVETSTGKMPDARGLQYAGSRTCAAINLAPADRGRTWPWGGARQCRIDAMRGGLVGHVRQDAPRRAHPPGRPPAAAPPAASVASVSTPGDAASGSAASTPTTSGAAGPEQQAAIKLPIRLVKQLKLRSAACYLPHPDKVGGAGAQAQGCRAAPTRRAAHAPGACAAGA
jgi:hypothetical protein